MTVTIEPARLRAATHVAIEGHAVNRTEALRLYNPDPEINSLGERIIALRRHGVPPAVVGELIRDVREIIALNDREGGCHTQLAGDLEQLYRAAAGEARGVAAAITVRGIVNALREPLATLVSPAGHSAAVVTRARARVTDVVATTPRERLLSPSVAHELGGRRYRLLTNLAGGARCPVR